MRNCIIGYGFLTSGLIVLVTIPTRSRKIFKMKSNEEDVLRKKEEARWKRILKVYGLTRENYEELDKGHCPVCVRDWSDTVRPVVDHDHVSNSVRGLLCIFCNRYRVGRLRDADLVQRIADYLRGPFKFVAPPKPKKKRKARKKT